MRKDPRSHRCRCRRQDRKGKRLRTKATLGRYATPTPITPLQAVGYAIALAGLVYYSLGYDQLARAAAAAARRPRPLLLALLLALLLLLAATSPFPLSAVADASRPWGLAGRLRL